MWYSLLSKMLSDSTTSKLELTSDRTEPQNQIPWLLEDAVDLEEEEEGLTISGEATIGKTPNRGRCFCVVTLKSDGCF